MLGCTMVSDLYFILLKVTNIRTLVAVCVEWCKAWAHSHRWTEEVLLLVEEMRRVVAYHEHRADWWRQRWDGLGCEWPSADHAEGARAYISKHANMHKDLIAQCRLVWGRERNEPVVRVVGTATEARASVPHDDADLVDSDSSEDVVEDMGMENFT